MVLATQYPGELSDGLRMRVQLEPDGLGGRLGLVAGSAPGWDLLHHGYLLDHVTEVQPADGFEVDLTVLIHDVDEAAPHTVGKYAHKLINLDGSTLAQPVPATGLDMGLLAHQARMSPKPCARLIVS